MPNALAFLVLFSWPVAVYLLFRYLPRVEALCWSILGGYLLLPSRTGFDLPLVPAVDKDVVPALTAALLLACGVGMTEAEKAAKRDARRFGGRGDTGHGAPMFGPFAPLIVLLILSPVVTVLTNSEPLFYGPVMLPGLSLHDAFSVIMRMVLTALPFLLAMRYLASPESHALLLKVIVAALLIYSLPVLFEVRMSPQLNVMFYGFFPHDFLQHIRPGGFRPVVFLQHGLWLALILCMAVIAAAALWRQRMSEGARSGQWFFAGVYLLIVLLLSNSLGAFVIALLLAPAALLLGVRPQLLIAGVIAAVVLIYPVLRSSGLVPTEQVVAMAERVSAERAASLQFRLDNEDALSARAALKPIAGWGLWGRNEIFDPETGRTLSVTDGAWIIVIGAFGWLGYIAQFGLLTMPTLLLAFGRKAASATPATAGLALVLAANLMDLLPNATLTPVTWLLGGAIAGYYLYRAPQEQPEGTAGADPALVRPRRSWGILTDRPPARPATAPQAAVSAAAPVQAGGSGGPAWHRSPAGPRAPQPAVQKKG
ncbi:hypothetical protein [Paragemmobacter ruber]|uniref:O-antigen ligase domain-containing protein n=1 Tax=Paragemmobacter ruber TaxID=1985673 RepID=A0ABW9Y223_9RHOB|nr:hypothetical protein [Rhodobacter ruber]NBE06553.1 hypothetical protein [Rhodobacter ruber]